VSGFPEGRGVCKLSEPHEIAWRVATDWTPQSLQSRKITGQIDSHHDLGVPVGGIGSGAINRGASGGFNRWTIKAGAVHYFDHGANGFSVWQPSLAGNQPQCRGLRNQSPHSPMPGWHFDCTGDYAALFPKAWHSYEATEEFPVSVMIEQLSPVVPELSKDYDLPVGIFRTHVHNSGKTPTAISLMFSFTNLVGWFDNPYQPGTPQGVAGQVNRTEENEFCQGVVFSRETVGEPGEGDGEILIATRKSADVELTLCPAFDAKRNGQDLWELFSRDGRIASLGEAWTSGGGFSEFQPPQLCGAVAARTELAPGQSTTIDFCLVFDLPVIAFGQARRWKRHYTSKWGDQGNSSLSIAGHALSSADHWSSAIDRFNDQCQASLDLPANAASLVVNELYFLTDGLTVWTAPDKDQPAHFGIIECPDYPLYNTMDLWVYGAHWVAEHFPELSRSVARDFAAEVPVDDREIRHHLRSTARFVRQRAGMLPHDLGAPNGDPFVRANDYAYQDSSVWKDLNAQFVLSAWLDGWGADDEFVNEIYPAVTQAMESLAEYDVDGDGLIENEGIPDQTFDNIPMKGASAYCGGLWLAALRATAAFADRVRDQAGAAKWREMSRRAEAAFDRLLWNGEYYRVDTDGEFSDALFSEQMFGPALARMYGLGDVVPAEHAVGALQCIYQRNFLEAGKGRGALSVTSLEFDSSLYAPEGEVGLQWDEILIGFNYSLAAQLRVYGLENECRNLMTTLADELGKIRGLMFRTPAAFEPDRPQFRSQMNMRPLGVWMLSYAARYRNG
jgi:non-lysosomal glucosylceramidase